MSQVVVEIDGAKNEALHFRPLQRRLRGRFDYFRDSEPMAKVAGGEQPNPIPGQRIGFDTDTGTGVVVEPLHLAEHRAIRERIESKGLKLPPEREEFPAADAATWLYWLAGAVKAGLARVVDGKLPDKLPGKPRLNFITAETDTATDRLAAAIERQNELFAALLDVLKKRG
jgi:hypothetical protein